MASTDGRLLRALPDRENWRLEVHEPHSAPRRHVSQKAPRARLSYWLRANVLRTMPATPGRDEAENAARLASAGIPAMSVIAFGERLHTNGFLESFAISEELAGYAQLDDFLHECFPSWNSPPGKARPRNRAFDRLLARGRSGRPISSPGLQPSRSVLLPFFCPRNVPGRFRRATDRPAAQLQHRRRLRRRWIVKDLAQLAYSARDRVSCSRKLAFFKAYLGVSKLRPADKRLAHRVLRKQWLMQLKLGPYR